MKRNAGLSGTISGTASGFWGKAHIKSLTRGTFMGFVVFCFFAVNLQAQLLTENFDNWVTQSGGGEYAPTKPSADWINLRYTDEDVPDNPNFWTRDLLPTTFSGRSNSARHTRDGNFISVSWLISPQITLDYNKSFRLRFQEWNTIGTNIYGYSAVKISTTGLSTSDFQIIYESENPKDWDETVLDLTDYAGENIRIAFVYENDDAQKHLWAIDSLVVEEYLELTVLDPIGIGGSNPAPGIHQKMVGSQVQLIAYPHVTHEFEKWIINGVDETTQDYSLTLNANTTIQAVFTEKISPPELLWRQHRDNEDYSYNFDLDRSANDYIIRNNVMFVMDDFINGGISTINKVILYVSKEQSWSIDGTENFRILLNGENPDWENPAYESGFIVGDFLYVGKNNANDDIYRVELSVDITDADVISTLSQMQWIGFVFSKASYWLRTIPAHHSDNPTNNSRRFRFRADGSIHSSGSMDDNIMFELWGTRGETEWTGTSATDPNDWHNDDNWTAGVPTATRNARIPVVSTSYPIVTGTGAEADNLVIENGASVTLGDDAILTLHGDLRVNGALTGQTGSTLSFAGMNKTLSGENADGIELHHLNVVSGGRLLVSSDITKLTLNGDFGGMGGFRYAQGELVFDGTSLFSGEPTEFVLPDVTISGSLGQNVAFTQNVRVNGNWSVSGSGTFELTAGKVVFQNTTPKTIASNASSYFNHVDFNGADVDITAGPMVVKGELDIKNVRLHTNNQYVQIDDDGSILLNESQTGRIIGEIRHFVPATTGLDINLPLGTANARRWAVMNYKVAPTAGYVKALYIVLNPGHAPFGSSENFYGNVAIAGVTDGITVNTLSEAGVWLFSNKGETLEAGEYDVKFNTHLIPNINSANDLRVLTSSADTPGLADWEALGVHTAPTMIVGGGLNAHWVYRNDVPWPMAKSNNKDVFWALGSNNSINPLPIELYSFTASSREEAVLVEWVTATEINNSHFTLERAYSDGRFEAIATIQGAGNSNQMLAYSYTDYPQAGQEIVYYRLTQHDFDGQFETFAPVAVRLEQQVAKGSLSLYPNPTQGRLNIVAQSPSDARAVIEIYNLSGRLMHQERMELFRGHNHNVISLSSLPSGVYMLRVVSDNLAFETQRVVVR